MKKRKQTPLSFRGIIVRLLTGVRGAEKYLSAIRKGDLVRMHEWLRRKEICKKCPSANRSTLDGAEHLSRWCGKPLVEDYDSPTPTCGCHLASKCAVASEACPQGKWVVVAIDDVAHMKKT